MRTVTFWLTKPFAHCQFKNREVDKVFRVRPNDLTYFKQSVAEAKSVAFSSQTPVAENWRGGFCRSSLTLLIWTSLCSLSTSKAWKRLARYQLSLCVKRTLLHENAQALRVKHARHDLHSDVIACMAEDRKRYVLVEIGIKSVGSVKEKQFLRPHLQSKLNSKVNCNSTAHAQSYLPRCTGWTQCIICNLMKLYQTSIEWIVCYVFLARSNYQI